MNPDSVWVFIENTNAQFLLSANDPDGSGISYSLIEAETGMSVAGNQFNWTPASSQCGFYLQGIIASDGSAQDTLFQQIAVYTDEQAEIGVLFSSANLYEEDNMYVTINNLYSPDRYQSVTLTNLNSSEQVTLSCRRVSQFKYIGQFSLSYNTRTDIGVQDGDVLEASYTYDGVSYTAEACYDSDPQPSDEIPPSDITDLVIESQSGNTVLLYWTSPGDDGNTGTAYRYDIRSSFSPIVSDEDFMTANLLDESLYPSEAGSTDSLLLDLSTIEGMTANDSIFFSIVSEDENQNRSSISNCSSIGILSAPSIVTATLMNDMLVEIDWTDMNQSVRTSRVASRTRKEALSREPMNLLGYRVSRIHNDYITVIADSLTSSSFIDSVECLADGEIQYRVRAIYDPGMSENTESNVLTLDRFVDIRVLCQQDGDNAADSVSYVITGQDTLYSMTFSGETNQAGIILLDDVYKTSYSGCFERPGCFPCELRNDNIRYS